MNFMPDGYIASASSGTGRVTGKIRPSVGSADRASVAPSMPAAEVLIQTQRNLNAAAEMLHRYLASEMVEDAPAFKAHYLLGNLLEQQGDTQAAVQEYRNALSLARDFTLAQSALKRLDRRADARGSR